MVSRLRANFLLFEWILPVVMVGLIFIFGGPIRQLFPSLLDGLRQTLYGTLATIFGGLLGFVIAGITILMTMGETRRIKLMFESGMFKQIIAIFSSAAKWLAFGSFIFIIGLVVDRDSKTVWWYSWLAAGVTVICGLRLWRCIWVLEAVIDLVLRDRQSTGKRVLPNISLETNPRKGMD